MHIPTGIDIVRRQFPFFLTIFIWFVASCGGVGDLSGSVGAGEGDSAAGDFADGDVAMEDGVSEAEDDAAAQSDLAEVKYVTLVNPDLPAALKARYAVNSDDADGETEIGCKSIEYDYEVSSPRTYCFKKASEVSHYMILRDADGKQILKLYAGAKCHRQDVRAGHYTMEVCHAGGVDAEPAATIFIARTDVSMADASEVPEEDDGFDGSQYDYGEEDVVDADVNARFLNLTQYNTFLTTNACVRCDLSGADFSGVDFTAVAPGFATLTGSDLTSADLTGADLTGSTLNKVKLDSADLTNAVLVNVNLTSATLKEADLTSAVLTGANLTRARLDDAILSNANLATANLTRARFNRALLDGANLNAASMTYVVLEYADLTGAVLTGAVNMRYAKAGAADFTNADFTNAVLTSTYFNGATLTNANLSGANLSRARFNSADLTTSDLTGATNAIQAVWKSAILTGATWSDGTACSVAPSVSRYDPSIAMCD